MYSHNLTNHYVTAIEMSLKQAKYTNMYAYEFFPGLYSAKTAFD